MRIIEYTPHILGTEFLRTGTKEPFRANYEILQKWMEIQAKSVTSAINLKMLPNEEAFFKAEYDLRHYVPAEERQEYFYALRNGFVCENVPAKCIDVVKRAYAEVGLPNLIVKRLTANMLSVIFSPLYLSECNLRDVICSFCDETYVPLTESTLMRSMGDYSEVYIYDTDMVAAIPNRIMENFSRNDICNIKVVNGALKLNDIYLCQMFGYVGIAPTYDLREVI